MPPTEPGPDPASRAFDARGWLAVAWAAVFGALYVRTVIECRGDALARWFRPNNGPPAAKSPVGPDAPTPVIAGRTAATAEDQP